MSLKDDGEYDLGDIWEEATAEEKEALSKKTIFSKARKKIKEKYAKERVASKESPENIAYCEHCDFHDIDFLEEYAATNLKESVKCRIECICKYILTEEGRIAWGYGIGLFVFNLLISVFSVERFSPRTWLFLLLQNLFQTAFYATIILTISFVLSLFKRMHKQHSKAFYISWLLAFVLCIPHIPVVCGYETTNIGDFYEAGEYTAKYYVIMSREPNSETNRKAYTLPAEIERRSDEHVETYKTATNYLDGETYEQEVSVLNYHINYLYFPNGGYLVFNYDEAYENPEYSILLLDAETKVTDYYGDDYYITLTSKKAE